VIVEKFEVLVAAWQVMLRVAVFTGTQRKTNQLKQVVGRAEACILKIANSFARDERCARHFFPLLCCSRPRRVS